MALMRGTYNSILLVDDHHLFREGLALLLASSGWSGEVFHAASMGEARRVTAMHRRLDLALLDLALPDLGALHAVECLKAAAPELTVVVMSADDSQSSIERCIALGAAGYITKTARPDEMRSALERVGEGQIALPEKALSSHGQTLKGHGTGSAHEHCEGGEALTPRQIEVLSLLVRGDSNKMMARTLGISENTVKTHLVTIYGNLQVTNRTQAVMEAARRKIKLVRIDRPSQHANG